MLFMLPVNEQAEYYRLSDSKAVLYLPISSTSFGVRRCFTLVTLSVKTTVAVKCIWVATPDALAGAPVELSFTQKDGAVEFTLPSLKYWTMIVMEH